MRSQLSSLALLTTAALCLGSDDATAQTLTTKRIAAGLDKPIWAGAPVGDDRIFIALKIGRIKILENRQLLATDFLDFSSQVNAVSNERGFLGMTFHPNYANNGFLFVNYTNGSGTTVISRWTVSASNRNLVDPSSEMVILTQTQPASNHNAGGIAFGNDGYLYVPLGDGGSSNDPNCNAQNLGTWLGKVLRLDVDSGSPYAIPGDNPFIGVPGALPEIYHLGLRNPFRSSFDSLTGDMYIGDVGQGAREEIDVAPFAAAGLNFGWKVMEGLRCNTSANCPPAQPACGSIEYTDPIVELFQSGFNGPRAIIGGYVYRGCTIPALQGTYFYADYNDDKIRSLIYDSGTGTVSNEIDRTSELAPGGGLAIQSIASFGEDGFGELLIVEHRNNVGEVYKIVDATTNEAFTTSRNGSGINPVCYTSHSLPIMGNKFRIEIDTSGHPGATFVGAVGYSAGSSGSFIKGREVLVDLSSGKIFSELHAATGGVMKFAPELPCDVSLNGTLTATQAFILGGSGFALCNALDITFGAF